jgi:competence protein ComEC
MNSDNYPIVKLTIFFVLGIVFAHYINLQPNLVFASGFFVLIFSFVSYFLSKRNSKIHALFSVMVLILFFNLGCLTTVIHSPNSTANNYSKILLSKTSNCKIKLQFTEQLKSSKKRQRFYASISSVDSLNVSGRMLVQIMDSTLLKTINLGQTYVVIGNYSPNKILENPFQFDYGNYLQHKYIFGQLYTDFESLSIEQSGSKGILFYANYVRNRIIKNLSNTVLTKPEIAIFSALLLGQKQDVANDVIKDYQFAGAIHILSVSGLHVGIILILLTFLLKPFPNTPNFRTFKLVVTLMFLWLFGIIAGLSPSILRSVTMFSFIAFANYLNRENSIYNTLALSIFCILLVKPNFIFDVGFQLSYSAVFGIVYLTPIFNNWFRPKVFVLDKLYQIVVVSFAAQLATLPICLYYFHQTTGLFFITNLLILPFLGILLGFGLLVGILAFFTIKIPLLLNILHFLLDNLNELVHYIASYKQLVFTNISFSLILVFSSYFFILVWFGYFKKPRFVYLVLGFVSVLILQSVHFLSEKNTNQTNQFIVFSKYRDSEFLIRKGSNLQCFISPIDSLSKEKHILTTNYQTANNCKLTDVRIISNLYYFKNKKILVIDEKSVYDNTLIADIIIIRNSPKINLDRLLDLYQPEIIVADGSNFKSYVELWKKTCSKKNIPFHSTLEKGYFGL